MIGVVGVIVIILITNIQKHQINNMNPWLREPRKNYDRPVEMSADDKAKYEQQITEYDTLIKDAINNMKDVPQTTSGEVSVESLPDEMWFVRKAQALQALWKYTEAIETINQLFAYYDESTMGRDTLGNMYRELEEYERAISTFQKIIETNGDEWWVYAKKISKMYVELGDGQAAGQWYIKYEENGWQRSKNLMDDIRALNK